MRPEDVPGDWTYEAVMASRADLSDRDIRLILAAVAPLIAAAERERCAKVADDCDLPWNSPTTEQHDNAILMAERIAAAIRALGDADG